ncbi:MAG: site-specific integrase [Solirubrobacteraceae bacterium]
MKAGFAAELERQGYSPATADPYVRRFGNLNGWMAREGLAVEDLSPAVVERFCSACRAAGYHHYTSIRGVKPLLAYLRAVGLAGEERMAQSPLELVLVRFACWLERERHLAPVSIATYVSHARPLLERFAVADRVALERLDAAAVRRFVVEVCPLQGRASAKLTVVAVRQLLAFLYLDGELERPLSAAVPSVAGIRLSGLPKRLERGEVQRILDACDRETVTGRRGFAIVMLMARLGVRGGEIANLVLDDVDWRAGEITVRGKGRELRLPLPAAVGEALVAYLGDGRPAGVETRAVFVTRLPPVRAMSRAAIREEIARLSERAGLGRVNAHRLRHTLAAEMLAGGADLPAIGQVLGHRMLETTAIYAKCDRDTLRRIARQWPGADA